MPGSGIATLLLCVAAGAVAAAIPRASGHGPAPGHTGGFGEPTCRACHFDGPERPSDAAVSIAGLPRAWTPGASYRIAVVLRSETMRRAGFQLTARFAAGEQPGAQAGTLAGSRDHIAVTDSAGIAYVHHTLAGTDVTAPGEVRWDVLWTAPAAAPGPIVFHVAANAANDDNSEFGDLVVTGADTVAAAPR